MTVENQQFSFNQLIALFLAEQLRSRRTSLRRAAEIAQLVLRKPPQARDEKEALSIISDIEKDFSEFVVLKQALHFGYLRSDAKTYEQEIKEFASQIFVRNMVHSATFLQDAARPGMSIQELCLRYPEFCNFLFSHSEKADLVPELHSVSVAGPIA